MKKHELARAIFEQRNELYLLTGQTVSDLDSPHSIGMIKDYASRHKVNELESELKGLTEKIAKINHNARVDEFYATPEGAALKAETEQAIERKRKEWGAHNANAGQAIDKVLSAALGDHWGVCRVSGGSLEIGIINPEKSTPTQRAFHSGMAIDITYDEWHWFDKSERFEASCSGTAAITIPTATETGLRAKFYIGFGQLLSDTELTAIIRTTLKESAQTEKRMSTELQTLQDRLANPFTEAE